MNNEYFYYKVIHVHRYFDKDLGTNTCLVKQFIPLQESRLTSHSNQL